MMARTTVSLVIPACLISLTQIQQSLIPAGHTFLTPKTFMSQKGYDTVRELLQKADNRNPDRFDMYIYNGLSYSYHYRRMI